MYSILLAITYIAFISLGLPDSLLGAAWPTMAPELSVPQSFAGIISMTISVFTILSTLLSDRLTRKFGTGAVTVASVLLTAIALVGFSLSRSFYLLLILAVPYGFGAGAVDAALNNYAAIHFKARHMSWLHCFWGLGATVGPYIMSYAISVGRGWQTGYGTVGIIQLLLAAGIFASLPLWKRSDRKEEVGIREARTGPRELLSMKGALPLVVAFFSYCALETTAGLWASSYLVEVRGTDTVSAASYASLFYLGITAGRFILGFAADKIGDKTMIRIGVLGIFAGIFMIALPSAGVTAALIGLVILGIGSAPIYPSIIHSTPSLFGKERSHALVGIQMASAYTGSTLMSPAFGFLASFIGTRVYPLYLFLFAVILLVLTERVNRIFSRGCCE